MEGLLWDPKMREDYALLEGNETTFSVDGTAVEIAGPSPHRVGLVFIGGVTQNLFISTKPGVTASTGLPISTNNNILELYLWRHGAIVTKQWFGITSGPAAVVGVIEVLYKG
jgi:hypothetical protein